MAMRTYTLHLPQDAEPGDPEPLEAARLVPDDFSWGAFFFTALWFFAHRLWLAGLGVLVAVVALTWALQALRVSPGAAVLAEFLLSWLIGLEAQSLRRWTYARSGRPAVDVVTAADRDEAEAKSFARWLARRDAPHAPAPSPAGFSRREAPVIGLFPEAERAR